VANLLLISARVVWIIVESDTPLGPSPESMATIVSLASGALLANVISIVLLIGDTLMSRR